MKTWFPILASGVLGLLACEAGPSDAGGQAAEEDLAGGGSLGFVVSAVGTTCSGSADSNPFDELTRLVIQVTAPEDDAKVVASKEFAVGQGTTSVSLTVPVGRDYTVTLKGFGRYDGDIPSWYARRRNVDVRQGSDNPPVEMVLARYGRFTCLTPAQNLTERMFPALVDLGDGRVLIAGGFQQAVPTGAGSDKYVLDQASKLAFIYDSHRGTLTQTANAMNEGRAAASAVLVSGENPKVLVFGGATRMQIKIRGDFEWFVDAADALKSYEVFDLKTLEFEPVPQDQVREMTMARVFPATLPLSENAVLIAGGSSWPGAPAAADARLCDLFVPDLGIQDRGPASDLMQAEHFAPAVAPLDSLNGRVRAVFFGGTTDLGAVVEVYTESSSKAVAGSFVKLAIPGITNAPFLASIVPLSDPATGPARFLAVGGVVKDGTRYTQSSTAYVLTLDRKDGLVVSGSAVAIQTACAKRFFHAAIPSFRPGRVTLLGGYTGVAQDPGGLTCFFDVAEFDKAKAANSALDAAFWQPAAGQEVFAPRAGHGSLHLEDDTVLLVGGMDTTKSALNGTQGALLELYAPPTTTLAP